MAKSSTVAFRFGSPYCDLPIQFWLVVPRLDGCRVMLGLVATAVPLTYNVPVLPDSVTARCVHWPTGSWVLVLICCSAPPPDVVIANRGPAPAFTVKNMYVPVPVPKSKTRDQVGIAAGFTHADTVKSLSPLTMPDGRFT